MKSPLFGLALGTAIAARCLAGDGRLLDVQTVALIGDPLPAKEGAFVVQSIRDAWINNLGEVGFRASNQVFDEGLWLGTPDDLRAVAIEGDISPLPGVPFGTIGATYVLNHGGQIAFFSSALWLGRPGDLTPLARIGDVAPGTDGSTFAGFYSNYLVLNDQGQCAFLAELDRDPGTGPRFGIWIASTDSFDLLVLDDDLIGPDGQFRLNNLGQVAFAKGSASSPPTSIWRGTPGDLSMLAQEGATVPGTSGLIHRTLRSHPSLNSGGLVAFSNEITGPGTNQFNDDAIWVGDRSSLAIAVREGDLLPQIGPGVHFNDLERCNPLLTSSGKVAFVTTVEGVGVTRNNDNSLWFGTSGNLELVAREGDLVPSAIAGWRFFRWSFGDAVPVANRNEQLAFTAPVSDGLQFGHGVFARDEQGRLRTLVVPGDVIEVRPDDFREVQSAGFPLAQGFVGIGGDDGLSSPLNDHGEIVFRAEFTDGSEGAFIVQIPTPCPGDFDQDDDVDRFDLLTYIDLWLDGDPTAEQTGDDSINAFDLQAFIRKWSLGCPPRRPAHPGRGPRFGMVKSAEIAR